MGFFNELKRRNVFRVGIAYTVAAWLLLQVTDIVFPRIGLPDTAITLVIALLGIGFIPALIFAWAYEMTPDGIKREKDVDRSASITPQTSRKLDRVIIIILALVIISMATERFWFTEQPDPQSQPADMTKVADSQQTENAPAGKISRDIARQKTVAVLPFTAMSSGEDDGYFADGLTEEILNSLTALPELLVTARTSSFHFKNKNLPVPEIAVILGVDHVVEGSVRRSGNRVRITAQLIRADDGFHLWSNTYDRTLEDIFAVQEDIAESIAQTLDVVLSNDKREKMKQAGIRNVEAFIAYQKGMEAVLQAHSTNDPIDLLPVANRYFDQALAIVPSITNAHLERTDLFGHILYNNASGAGSFTPAELDTALAEILAGLSQAARYAKSDEQRAYIEAERAEFTDDWSSIPSNLDRAFRAEQCYAVNWVTSLAASFGWAADVSAHLERLMRCDPLSGLYVALGGQYLIWAGQANTAIAQANHFLNTVEFNAWVDDTRFAALLASGDFRDDPGKYNANTEGSYFEVPRRLFTYAMEKNLVKAREILETAKKTSSISDLALLIAEASLGNREAANAYASKLDSRFAGPFALAEAVKGCLCGAPFDLDATPNFKARIEEAGFSWPPGTPIKYPAKDW